MAEVHNTGSQRQLSTSLAQQQRHQHICGWQISQLLLYQQLGDASAAQGLDQQQVRSRPPLLYCAATLLTPSSFLIDPYTYNYLQSRWTNKVNAQSLSDVTAFPGVHTTDVTTQKALAMIDAATAAGRQFFMMVTGGQEAFHHHDQVLS